MRRSSPKDRVTKVTTGRSARDEAALDQHIEEASKLSVDEITELLRTDAGTQQLRGPFNDTKVGHVRMPIFNEVDVAVPGRMIDEEHAKILSGGTRHEWGPWRRFAKRLMARRRST
jgi:hypothetical protein